MENPDGQLRQCLCCGWQNKFPHKIPCIATAANWYGRSKTPGIFRNQAPSTKPSHAESGHADAIAVNSETMSHIVQKSQQGIRLPYFSLSTLGRNKHERKIWIRFNQLWRTMHFDFLQIISALACPVKEKEKRPFAVARLFVTRG